MFLTIIHASHVLSLDSQEEFLPNPIYFSVWSFANKVQESI